MSELKPLQSLEPVEDVASSAVKALTSDPNKLNELLNGNLTDVVKSLVGSSASAEDLTKAVDAVKNNDVVKLFLGSNGTIDATELVDVTNAPASRAAGSPVSVALNALQDGKISTDELMTLAGLLGTVDPNAKSNNQGANLLNSLLGSQSSNANAGLLGSLLGGGQQQSNQSLLGSLLGGNQQQSSGLLGSLFGSNQQQTTSNSLMDALFQSANSNNSGLLGGLLGGSTNNKPQSSLLSSLLGTGSSSAATSLLTSLLGGNSIFNAKGGINIMTLLKVASALLK